MGPPGRDLLCAWGFSLAQSLLLTANSNCHCQPPVCFTAWFLWHLWSRTSPLASNSILRQSGLPLTPPYLPAQWHLSVMSALPPSLKALSSAVVSLTHLKPFCNLHVDIITMSCRTCDLKNCDKKNPNLPMASYQRKGDHLTDFSQFTTVR